MEWNNWEELFVMVNKSRPNQVNNNEWYPFEIDNVKNKYNLL